MEHVGSELGSSPKATSEERKESTNAEESSAEEEQDSSSISEGSESREGEEDEELASDSEEGEDDDEGDDDNEGEDDEEGGGGSTGNDVGGLEEGEDEKQAGEGNKEDGVAEGGESDATILAAYEGFRRENIQRNKDFLHSLGVTDLIGRIHSQTPTETEVLQLSEDTPPKKRPASASTKPGKRTRAPPTRTEEEVSDEDLIKRPRRSIRLQRAVSAGRSKRKTSASKSKNRTEKSRSKSNTPVQEDDSDYRASEDSEEEEDGDNDRAGGEDTDSEEEENVISERLNPKKLLQGTPSKPVGWQVRQRPLLRNSTPAAVLPPRPPLKSASAKKNLHLKMSEDTWSDRDEGDYDLADGIFQDAEGPSNSGGARDSPMREPTGRAGPSHLMDLDLEIAEKELVVLTKRRDLHMQQGGQGGTSTSQATLDHAGRSRSYEAEQKSRRRDAERQLREDISKREQEGKRRYIVNVDRRGKPVGEYRAKWLTSLRGHAANLDFSICQYENHDVGTLLSIKSRLDKTFDYRGGVGRVTEEAFHSILRGQLKMRRYHVKKIIQSGKERPDHVAPQYWESMKKLIADESKQEESKKMTFSRSQVRKVSVAGRSEEEVRANLALELERSPTRQELEAELGREKGAKKRKLGSSASAMSAGASRHEATPSPSSRVSDMVVEKDLERRIFGLETGMSGLHGDMTGVHRDVSDLQRDMKRLISHFNIDGSESPKKTRVTSPASSSGQNKCKEHGLLESESERSPNAKKKLKEQVNIGNVDPYDLLATTTLQSVSPHADELKDDELKQKEDVVQSTAEELAGTVHKEKATKSSSKEDFRDKGEKTESTALNAGGASAAAKVMEHIQGREDSVKVTKSSEVVKPKPASPAPKKKARAPEGDKVSAEKDGGRGLRSGKVTSSKSGKDKGAVEQKKSGKEKPLTTKAAASKAKKTEGVSKKASKKIPSTSEVPFKADDVVQLMGVADGEEDLVVADAQVLNLEGSLHSKPIPDGCASVQVYKSHDNGYILYETIRADDPPITTIGKAVGYIILWPLQFMRHSNVKL